ncbi:MAG: Rpn family recombination-promoting nuclease/putative transposase [Treponema sp.]|nr:Rpn family recombination-promoting nuclease/putative transposase [Treponema sp.]
MKVSLLSFLSPEARRQARENIRRGIALDPLSDIVFKTLFTANNRDSREACRCLLSACTRRPVVSLSVKNNELLPDILTGKTIRLDAHLAFNDGEKADLEMQMHKTSDDLQARAMVCASKLLSAQPLRGESYRKVKRVYQIFFLNFELFSGSDKIPRRYTMREEHEQDELTNLVTVIFYELPKLEMIVRGAVEKKGLKVLPEELKWGIYLRYRNAQRIGGLIEELCRAEEGIMHAERALKRLSLSENIWWWKYARDKRRMDYVSEMAARKEALEEAREEGLTEGRKETEAKYQAVVEAKEREIEELRRKLRKAGIDG